MDEYLSKKKRSAKIDLEDQLSQKKLEIIRNRLDTEEIVIISHYEELYYPDFYKGPKKNNWLEYVKALIDPIAKQLIADYKKDSKKTYSFSSLEDKLVSILKEEGYRKYPVEYYDARYKKGNSDGETSPAIGAEAIYLLITHYEMTHICFLKGPKVPNWQNYVETFMPNIKHPLECEERLLEITQLANILIDQEGYKNISWTLPEFRLTNRMYSNKEAIESLVKLGMSLETAEEFYHCWATRTGYNAS